MRVAKKIDHEEISRRSIRRDFARTNKRRAEDPEASDERRIASVNETSSYYKYRHLIIGKLVRLIERSEIVGWVCEFVHDDDRVALNAAAGWSDMKCRYLFDGIKLK